jgi:hypothetical protein
VSVSVTVTLVVVAAGSRSAPVAPVSTSRKVNGPAITLSSRIGTVIVLVTSPGWNDSVPEVAV